MYASDQKNSFDLNARARPKGSIQQGSVSFHKLLDTLYYGRILNDPCTNFMPIIHSNLSAPLPRMTLEVAYSFPKPSFCIMSKTGFSLRILQRHQKIQLIV